MDFELSLLIIQTITGIISLYLGYKAIKLNNEVSKNSNNDISIIFIGFSI